MERWHRGETTSYMKWMQASRMYPEKHRVPYVLWMVDWRTRVKILRKNIHVRRQNHTFNILPSGVEQDSSNCSQTWSEWPYLLYFSCWGNWSSLFWSEWPAPLYRQFDEWWMQPNECFLSKIICVQSWGTWKSDCLILISHYLRRKSVDMELWPLYAH